MPSVPGAQIGGRVVDPTGRPRPGATVSNGRDVRRTADDGSFELPAGGPYVFLTRPDGWTADPWYLPAAADMVFTLEPADQPLPYRLVHLSDPHLGDGAPGLPSPRAMADLLASLSHRAPDAHAVVITGDLTQHGSDGEYAALLDALRATPLPVHLMPGNHDHLGGAHTGMVVSRNNYLVDCLADAGSTAVYERHLGPRWYSFDLPGLHVVALDWHSHELGLDHETQNAWLHADLATVPPDRPWILLAHDQPGGSILGHAPRPPLATLSGHWHTSRVTMVDGTLHVSTPPALFAGLDCSPPALRIVTWDGERLTLDTRTHAAGALRRATFGPPDPPTASRSPDGTVRWRHQLPGGGHRAAPRLAGDMLVVPVRDEDRPGGGVDAVAVADGSLVWRAESNSAVKSTPVVVRDLVVAVEVSGDVVGLSLVDGSEWWRAPSPDPLRRFGWAAAAVGDGVGGDMVIVGDQTHLRALDVATGTPRWERADLSPHHNIAGHAAPVVVGDTVVVGYWPWPPSFVGLDLATGQIRWPCPPPYTAEAHFATSAPTPLATPLLDPRSGDLFAPTLGRVLRIDAATGRECWSASTEAPFNAATPASTPHGIATVDAYSGVLLLDREDGTVLWRTSIAADERRAAPLPMAPYAADSHPLLAGPVPRDNVLLVPTLDGWIHALDGRTGEPVGRLDVGVPVAAPVTAVDDLVVVLCVDGAVLAVDIEAVWSG